MSIINLLGYISLSLCLCCFSSRLSSNWLCCTCAFQKDKPQTNKADEVDLRRFAEYTYLSYMQLCSSTLDFSGLGARPVRKHNSYHFSLLLCRSQSCETQNIISKHTDPLLSVQHQAHRLRSIVFIRHATKRPVSFDLLDLTQTLRSLNRSIPTNHACRPHTLHKCSLALTAYGSSRTYRRLAWTAKSEQLDQLGREWRRLWLERQEVAA